MVRSSRKKPAPRRCLDQSKRLRRARLALEPLEDRLAPAIATPGAINFAVIGDFANPNVGDGGEAAVSRLVHGWNPMFITTVGDNNYTAPTTTANYDTNTGQFYHDYIYPYNGSYGAGATTNKFFPILGNHDWGEVQDLGNYVNPTGDQAYLSYFTGLPGNARYYTFTQGPVQFFMLDDDYNEPDGNSANSVQAQWLHAQLAASTAPWKLVFFHHPAYSSGAPSGSDVWPYQAWGASAVLSGHDHDYERVMVNGFPNFIEGSGGAGLNNPSPTPFSGSVAHDYGEYGAMYVTASASQITFKHYAVSGNLIDTYTMNYSLPAAPSSVSTTPVSTNQMNVQWTANGTNQAGYDIERSTDGTNFTQVATAGPTATSYLDSGLGSGVTYYYRVAALSAGGPSAYSNTASNSTAVVFLNRNPAPTNLSTSVASASQVNLTWTDNSSGQDSFIVLRSADGTNYTQIASVPAGTSVYSDTGLAAATYYYQVQAQNGGASDGTTSVVSAALAPAAPTNLTTTAASDGQINLSWTNNASNATGFNVLQSTDGANFTQIASLGPTATSYASYFLTPSTTYYYKVSTVNASGATSSAASSVATLPTLPPAAPSNLTATPLSSTRVILSWTDNSSAPYLANGFYTYQSTDGVNYTRAAYSATQYQTSIFVGSLLPNTTYYFKVSAFGDDAESVQSAAASTTTLAVPAAPSNLAATAASATQINLSWTDNSGTSSSNPTATSFKVYKSTDGVNFFWLASTGQGVTSYSWGAALPSTTYSFYVTAAVSAGESSPSTSVNVTSLPVPAAPSNVTATAASATQVNLSWTDNSGTSSSNPKATSFKLYRSTDQVNWSWFATSSTTSYSWYGGSAATTYYFYVKASVTAGDSTASNTASATTMPVPAAPSNAAANASNATTVNLTWTDNSGTGSGNPTATSFKLYRSTDQVNWAWFATAGQGVTSYTWYGGTAGTTYYFYIKASANAGDSAPSNTATVTTPGVPLPPSNMVATAVSSSHVNVSWQDNSVSPNSATSFRVYRSTDQVNWSWFATTNQGVTTYAWYGGSAGTTYYFRVVANDANGNSPASNIASATTVGSSSPTSAPAAPSSLSASAASSSQINLSWTNNANNQDGFYIYQSPDGTNFTLVASTAAGVTSYSITGLSASTPYYFKVSAYNPVGTSGYTSVANATTNASSGGGGHLVAGSLSGSLILGVGQTVGWSQYLGAPASIGVYVYNPDGSLTADEHARIDDAIAALNNATWNGTTGLNIVEVTDPTLASIIVENVPTTQDGGQAQGLLGDTESYFDPSSSFQTDGPNPYFQFNGMVTANIVEGWNFYAGQDPTAIPSDAFDYETVVLHELGHAVGLYHDITNYPGTNDGYSVMYPALNAGVVRRAESPFDVAWLQHLYAYGANPGTTQLAQSVDDLTIGASASAADLAVPAHTAFLKAWEAARQGQTLKGSPIGPESSPLAGATIDAIAANPAAVQASSRDLLSAAPGSGAFPVVVVSTSGVGGANVDHPATAIISPPGLATGMKITVSPTAPEATRVVTQVDSRFESGSGYAQATAAGDVQGEDLARAAESPKRTAFSTGAATSESSRDSWADASTAYFGAIVQVTDGQDDADLGSAPLEAAQSPGLVVAVASGALLAMLASDNDRSRGKRSWLKYS
jgi:titin